MHAPFKTTIGKNLNAIILSGLRRKVKRYFVQLRVNLIQAEAKERQELIQIVQVKKIAFEQAGDRMFGGCFCFKLFGYVKGDLAPQGKKSLLDGGVVPFAKSDKR